MAHLWGYRNYETGEQSRNNWFVALISNGEGWHNNHHADLAPPAHGHRWWEIDVVYVTIRALESDGTGPRRAPACTRLTAMAERDRLGSELKPQA